MSTTVWVEEVQAMVDAQFAPLIARLQRLGVRTKACCSGLACDHEGRAQESYIYFLDDTVSQKILPAGLLFDRDTHSGLIIRSQFAMDGTTWEVLAKEAEGLISPEYSKPMSASWRYERERIARQLARRDHGGVFVEEISDREHFSLWLELISNLEKQSEAI